MRLLQVAIACYIVGLMVFYLYAVFGTKAWDFAYFGWAKICDVGVLMWGVLYYNLRPEQRNVVFWLFWFSVIRFACDVQTWFTGVGVNNEWIVAALFLILILVLCVLTIKEFKKIKRQL